MRPSRLVVISGLMVACGGGAEVRGGWVVAPKAEPTGTVTGSWTASACVDAEGRPVPTADGSRVERVRLGGTKTVLVEALDGHESLVVEATFFEGDQQVFQVVLEPSDGVDQLRDFRVPRRGGSTRGRMAVVQRWEETETKQGGFRADFGAPLVACALWSDPR